jgi:hypothetical protein
MITLNAYWPFLRFSRPRGDAGERLYNFTRLVQPAGF